MTRARLGQNFLIDTQIQERIVEYFNPPGAFGEIGPGHGELTQILARKFSDFLVFEKDHQLSALHRAAKNYKTFSGDFLDWDFKVDEKPVENFSFIGNLPYESGTAIVKRIAERSEQIDGFVFMLQKEVVERLVAKPQTRDFGSLTVLVQGQFDVEPLDIIPPEAFSPAPEVHSQLIRGKRRESGRHSLDPAYQKFVQASFLHKRKTLKNALKAKFSRQLLDQTFEELGFEDFTRAEEIPVDRWPELYAKLN